MREQIVKCDLCGVEHSNLNNNRNWSDCICEVELSFKEHHGLQAVPFSGDICTVCGRKLQEVIIKEVNRIKTAKTSCNNKNIETK